MTGSVALDVVIALVFIYSLYSLLTTTLVELIASAIRMRASFLEKGIQRMLDDGSGKKVFSEAFYKQPLIKYLASNAFFGWIKQPSYLSAQNFSKILIDLLKQEGLKSILKKEAISQPHLYSSYEKISAVLNDKGHKFADSETLAFMNSLLVDAQGDLDKFKGLIEKWYDDTMERVTSWYKRQAHAVTIIVGFTLAFFFNVDTIKIVEKLSKDPKAREQFIAMAQKFAENEAIAKQVYGDSVNREYTEIKATFNDLKKQAFESNDVLAITRAKDKTGNTIYSNWTWLNFWGWLITAIALSLGAPFWFDLLNKLMKLRSSVQVASSTGSTTGNANINSKKPEPVG